MPQTPADVRRIDHNAVHLGVPTSRLMDNAGAAVAEEARRLGNDAATILVLVGPGNNGGDGLVAATDLARDHEVRVVAAREEFGTPEAQAARRRLDEHRVLFRVHNDAARLRQDLRWADLVIDALLGIGLSGPLRDPVRAIVKAANSSGNPILSVDVPTGLGADLQIRPRLTVALHDKKVGSTRRNSGTIRVRAIGVPPEAETRCGPGDLIAWWRPNAPASRKGDNGRLLIVAGGPYNGAPVLASLGALRAGIDLVRLYTPGRVARAAMASHPDLIVHEGADEQALVPDDLPRILGTLPKTDAVLVGPGLGKSAETAAAVHEILRQTRRTKTPIVVDADAVAMAKGSKDLGGRPSLVTPHAGEFQALTGRRLPKSDAAVWRHVEQAAKDLRTTVLLKGPVDRVGDGTTRRENHTHTPVMSRGGTGDVLAGVASAFMARGAAPVDAASSAAFLVGETARHLAATLGHGVLASDIADALATRMTHWLSLDAHLETF